MHNWKMHSLMFNRAYINVIWKKEEYCEHCAIPSSLGCKFRTKHFYVCEANFHEGKIRVLGVFVFLPKYLFFRQHNSVILIY